MPNGRPPFLYNDDHLLPAKSNAGPGSGISTGSLYEQARQRLRMTYSHAVQWGHQEWNGMALDYEGARCILQAAFLAEKYAPEAMLEETGYELGSLLKGLIPGLLQMIAVVGATTVLGGVIGGIVGAFAGGVGAIPGAAVGADLGLDVGMALLTWLGLAFLAVSIAKGIGQLVEAIHAGVMTAWAARNKKGMEERLQVERAAHQLARAAGILMRLILIGIVAYLLKKAAVKSTKGAIGTVKGLQSAGATEVSSATVADLVGKLRASKFGKDGFADWIEKNWQKLVKDPKLQESTLEKGSAAPQQEAATPPSSAKPKTASTNKTPAAPSTPAPAVQKADATTSDSPVNPSILETRSADQVNQDMIAAGDQPAWLSGTDVVTQTVPTGTQYQMVVSQGQAQALARGEPAFGGWASPDSIPDQDYARQNLSILPEFKPDVGYVATVETTAPQTVNSGFAGPLGDTDGGGSQVQFVGQRNLKLVGQPTPLPGN